VVDGISCLREAIETVPVPGAPPRLSRDGAAVGLAFLDAALRLNHVRRLTERLSLVEHGVLHRTTEIEVSLNMLDSGQAEAAMLFRRLASPTLTEADSAAIGKSTMWVPVARTSRRSADPVDVRDAAGTKVPRLTQYETSRLLASGLYRLLRESLTTHPDSSNTDTDLSRILFKVHEPRWLIQAALLTLFTERNRPAGMTVARPTRGTVDGHVRQYRNLALDVFDNYRDYLKDYSALLNVALNEHLLVVALDTTSEEHLLSFDSPMYVNRRRATIAHGLWQTLRASGEGYYVQYHTSIPATLRSYHLVLETAPGVDIRQIYMSTDTDAKTLGSLDSDLQVLAGRLDRQYQAPRGDPARKVLELEMQTALRKVAEVVRRRRWEASHAGFGLPEQALQATLQLTQAVVAGEATVDDGERLNNSILKHPSVSPGHLRGAVAELAGREMLHDLSLERDPVTNRAHAYWRPPPERSINSGQVRIRAGAILRDATGAGPRDALLYTGVLAGTAYLMACFLTRSVWPYAGSRETFFRLGANAEAVIAVLLVVPGFLYTRLTLPDPHSISGHLRAVPRLVVRICIFSMVIIAAAVAAAGPPSLVRLSFIVGTLLPVASTVLLLRRRPYDRKKALGRMGAPTWSWGERTRRSKPVTPDVLFDSANGQA
jgi:hypothetical protein